MSRQSVVYGPVPSRRFGLSLGVDIIPHKVCSYDCVYCQLGPTTDHTMQRRNFLEPDVIIEGLGNALESGPCPDVITLAGSGEPTLHAKLGSIIEGIARITDIPLVLLTNGSLLHIPEIRSEIAALDILAPSLDAGDSYTFREINRPCSGMDFDMMIEGLRDTVVDFDGTIRLETMLLWGLNTDDEQLDNLIRMIDTIAPDFVDINTPVRPNPLRDLTICPSRFLEDVAKRIKPRASIIVSRPEEEHEERRFHTGDLGGRILRMLSRRPCSLNDISAVTGASRNHILKILDVYITEGRVKERKGAKDVYFFAPP